MSNEVFSRLSESLVDRYRIERELGAGGMATVYRAHDLKHDRAVALKVLHPDLSSSLGAERFAREVRTAARLQHPNILTVFDSGDADGQLWYTMPLVDGESLRDRLNREQQLPVQDALRIAVEAARGLAHAHSQGVVHRDVKPENLLLTRDGCTLVADFGIARGFDAAEHGLTGTGMSLGTPAYMSPEQASGEREIDARSDIYALAAVMYEMLAGEPPFTGPNAQAVIARILTQTPRPINPIRSAVSPALDRVIAKAMSRTPTDRFSTMESFAKALTVSASGENAAGPAPRSRRTRSVILLPLALLVVAALTAAFVLKRQPPSSARDARGRPTSTSIAVLPFENRGRPDDAYIGDGIVDEIRGKLSGVPGLSVIARTSSRQYNTDTKPLEQIASELGVNYVLTGTVQFERSAVGGQKAKIRVRPELIQLAAKSAPVTRWQATFDTELADVFTVQSEIAGRVASALDIALGASQKARLAERPTTNLEAYDAYLKGEAISRAVTAYDRPTLQRALVEYEKAVALDPRFVAAWARISRAHGLLFYWTDPTIENETKSRDAAHRALSIDSARWEAHWAKGLYLTTVAHRHAEAIDYENRALELSSANSEVLTALSNSQQFAGRFSEAVTSAEQARLLDPRSVDAWRRSGFALMGERKYADAVEALERGLQIDSLEPQTHYRLFSVRLAQGDVAAAKRALAIPSDSVAQGTALVTAVAYQNPVDSSMAAAVLRLPPERYADRARWAVNRARAFFVLGNTAASHVWADSALAEAKQGRMNASPLSPRPHAPEIFAYALLGRRPELEAAAQAAMRAIPLSGDALDGALVVFAVAQAYAILGDRARALDLLESILVPHTFVQPGWARNNPMLASLRGDPRFERMTRIP
jgi:serine/threonine protein kinase/tetratricopeptide (TPR) repeat protein